MNKQLQLLYLTLDQHPQQGVLVSDAKKMETLKRVKDLHVMKIYAVVMHSQVVMKKRLNPLESSLKSRLK